MPAKESYSPETSPTSLTYKLINEPGYTAERREIVHRFTECFESAEKIASALGIRINPKGLALKTMRNHVRRVISALVPDEVQQQVNSAMHSNVVRSNPKAKVAIRNSMEKKGFFVWSDDERDYLLELVVKDEFLKPESRQSIARRKAEGNRPRIVRQPLDHALIASAMNENFQTQKFTKAHTRDKLERLRRAKTMRERNGSTNLLPSTVQVQLDD